MHSSALNSDTNEHVAVKKIANAFDNKIDAKRTLREIKLLRHMDHENVSESLFYYFFSKKKLFHFHLCELNESPFWLCEICMCFRV